MRYVQGGAAAISVLTEPELLRRLAGRPGGGAGCGTGSRAAQGLHRRPGPDLGGTGRRRRRRVCSSSPRSTPRELAELLAAVAATGMEALVEAHTAAEVETAVAAGAEIVGVNNRDLATFITDLAVAEAIAPSIPDGVVTVGESGVSSIAGAARMAAAGYDAILVGEAAVRSADPGAFIAELREAGR